MASVNKVILMGRLGQDPELRYTQSQVPVVNMSIATTEYRGDAGSGQRQEFTEWHKIVVWNRQAENCAKYLVKGSGVYIEGKLQTRSWDDQNGQKKYSTEIVANTVQFLPKGNKEAPSYNDSASANQFSGNGQKSFGGESGNNGQRSMTGNNFPPANSESSAPAPSGDLDDIPF